MSVATREWDTSDERKLSPRDSYLKPSHFKPIKMTESIIGDYREDMSNSSKSEQSVEVIPPWQISFIETKLADKTHQFQKVDLGKIQLSKLLEDV